LWTVYWPQIQHSYLSDIVWTGREGDRREDWEGAVYKGVILVPGRKAHGGGVEGGVS